MLEQDKIRTVAVKIENYLYRYNSYVIFGFNFDNLSRVEQYLQTTMTKPATLCHSPSHPSQSNHWFLDPVHKWFSIEWIHLHLLFMFLVLLELT